MVPAISRRSGIVRRRSKTVRRRPHTSQADEKIQQVREIAEDRRLPLWFIAEEPNISYRTAQEIVCGILGEKKLCAHFVPHTLTDEQKK